MLRLICIKNCAQTLFALFQVKTDNARYTETRFFQRTLFDVYFSRPPFDRSFLFSLYFFIFFALRPPPGGIDDGAGGFAQSGHAALRGYDGEQRLDGLEKLWPLGACKDPQRCRQFFKRRSLS